MSLEPEPSFIPVVVDPDEKSGQPTNYYTHCISECEWYMSFIKKNVPRKSIGGVLITFGVSTATITMLEKLRPDDWNKTALLISTSTDPTNRLLSGLGIRERGEDIKDRPAKTDNVRLRFDQNGAIVSGMDTPICDKTTTCWDLDGFIIAKSSLGDSSNPLPIKTYHIETGEIKSYPISADNKNNFLIHATDDGLVMVGYSLDSNFVQLLQDDGTQKPLFSSVGAHGESEVTETSLIITTCHDEQEKHCDLVRIPFNDPENIQRVPLGGGLRNIEISGDQELTLVISEFGSQSKVRVLKTDTLEEVFTYTGTGFVEDALFIDMPESNSDVLKLLPAAVLLCVIGYRLFRSKLSY